MAAEATSASVPDSVGADLTADYFPAQPIESEQGGEPVQAAAETADAGTEQTDQSAQAPTVAPAPPQRIRIGDREFTQEELNAALTTAQQLPHLQQKYLQLLEKTRQQPQAPQAQQPQAPQGRQGLMPEQIKALYQPAIKQAVESGYIEEELATAFPAFAANALMFRDLVSDVREAVGHLIERTNNIERGSTERNVIGEIDGSIASLATQGEHFAPLADPNVRQQFFQYLVELNPQVGHMRNPDFIARQWFAYNKDTYLANATAAQQANAQAQARRTQARRNAQGEGNSTRPGGSPPAVEGFYDADLLGDRFPALR